MKKAREMIVLDGHAVHAVERIEIAIEIEVIENRVASKEVAAGATAGQREMMPLRGEANRRVNANTAGVIVKNGASRENAARARKRKIVPRMISPSPSLRFERNIPRNPKPLANRHLNLAPALACGTKSLACPRNKQQS